MVGTLIGGWLAYGLISASDNDGFLTTMLFVVAIIGNLMGKRLDLAYGVGKLMLLTFTAGMLPCIAFVPSSQPSVAAWYCWLWSILSEKHRS